MRIISQDGMEDLPYESIGICINYHSKTDIIAYPAANFSSDDEYWRLAHYSSEEKAKKAMELLREAYMAHNQYESMTAEQRVLMINLTDEKEQEKLYGLFRFPDDDDDEIEV